MLDRLADLEREHAELEARLADPVVLADQGRYQELARRFSELEAVVDTGRRLRAATEDLAAARELLRDAEGGDRQLLRDEVATAETAIGELSTRLAAQLVPRDPDDDKDVIVEIRGAEGGEEANLFARDLFAMYQGYAARRGWRIDVLSSDASDMGGFNEVVFAVRGTDVWSRLRHEGGPHRVQRVPVTESQGRVHTSSATVTVLPEAEEVDVAVDPNDLQIDVYRSSGPGGQSVNTTDSAVRITHRPSGIVVAMQDEKSQLQNRAKAMVVLRSRLLAAERQRQAAAASAVRKGQVGGGGRAEKIRTYNFKENRVTDHRIGLTLYRLDKVLGGDLDEILDALLADEQARRLAGG